MVNFRVMAQQIINDDIAWFCSVIDALHDEGTLPRPTKKGRAMNLYAPVLVYRHMLNLRRRQLILRPLRLCECTALYEAALQADWLCIREAIDATRHRRRAVLVNHPKNKRSSQSGSATSAEV